MTIHCGIYYYTTSGIFTGVRHYDDQIDVPCFPQPRQTHFIVDPVAHPFIPGHVCSPSDDECRILVGLHRRKPPLDMDAARVCVVSPEGKVVAILIACAQNCDPVVHGFPNHIFIHDRTAQIGDVWDSVKGRTVVMVHGVLLPKRLLHLRRSQIHRLSVAA